MRSARRTARTANVRAVLRHCVPNKGLHSLRRYAAIPAALPSSAKTGVIYGQALGKPVESRNLRFELLHLPLPDVMLEALKRLKSVCPILLAYMDYIASDDIVGMSSHYDPKANDYVFSRKERGKR